MKLTSVQYDALVEIFNIAISHAAVSLSRLMNEKVRLSSPLLNHFSVREAIESLDGLSGFSDGHVAVVTQHFAGDIDTRALLLFPPACAVDIVRIAVGGLVDEMLGIGHMDATELQELEQEALAEVGNILLNACISAFSHQLRIDLQVAPPAYLLMSAEDLFASHAQSASDVVLMVHVELNIERHHISAYIAFLLDARAKRALARAIDRSFFGVAHAS